MKLTTLFVLRGQGMTRLLWKPRIMTSNDQIMAKAIRAESEAARATGRTFEPWNCIHRFQLATGALRLTNAEANLLLSVIYKAMEQEQELT